MRHAMTWRDGGHRGVVVTGFEPFDQANNLGLEFNDRLQHERGQLYKEEPCPH